MGVKTFALVLFCIVFVSLNSKADEMTSVPIATYEEVKDLPNHPEKLLIDVREPAEIVETGSIPTAINIPCKFINFTRTFQFFKDKLSKVMLAHCGFKWVMCDDRSQMSCRTKSSFTCIELKNPSWMIN